MPNGGELITLRDAEHYIAKLPKRQRRFGINEELYLTLWDKSPDPGAISLQDGSDFNRDDRRLIESDFNV